MRLADVASGALLVTAVSCAGVAPPPAVTAPASVPFGSARPFAALYRLDCCGQRGLLLTARGDGERLALSVASGPAGAVVEAWVDASGGVVRSGRERCARPLAGGRLQLAGGGELPARPGLVALLARGTVPEDARPLPDRPGWLAGVIDQAPVRWRVASGVVAEVEVAEEGTGAPALALALAEHHGRIPGRIEFRTGAERGTLSLVEWRETTAPAPPAWVSWPACEAGR